MNCSRLMCCALLCVLMSAGAAAVEKQTVTLEDVDYVSVEVARKVWRPLERKTPPIELTTVAGRQLLKLPCNFSTNDEWRTAWDLSGRWNLSGCRDLSLRFAPGNRRWLRMTVYLRSGRGWYWHSFFLPEGGRTVIIPRHHFKAEDRPDSWGSIDTIRLSVRRDKPEDAEVRLAGISALIYPARVALYRNDAGLKREEGISRFTRIVADVLDRLGVDFELVGDKDVAAGKLTGKEVAVLPLNPVISRVAAEQLRKFVTGGGKLIACYTMADPIGELLGVESAGIIDGRKDGSLTTIVIPEEEGKQHGGFWATQNSWLATKVKPRAGTRVVGYWGKSPWRASDMAAITRNANGYFVGHVLTRDDPKRKEQLMLEMLTDLAPGLWKDLYEEQLARVGKVAGLSGIDELTAKATKNMRGDRLRKYDVTGALGIARVLLAEAHKHADKGEFRAACTKVREAQWCLTVAYARSISSRKGEFRAVWCHSPAGIKGKTWDETMKSLADNGFNAIIPNMCWGDGAAYKSKALPMVTETDELAKCLSAAKKHGIAVHVWKVNWRCWRRNPKEFRERMKQEGRLQQDIIGRTLGWLCPSHPANRKLEIDAMLEIVRNYDVAGIHFDYIRYPGRRGCYCPRCRESFEKKYGLKVRNWPQDVRTGELQQKYLQFRRDNITAVVAEVSARARKMKPNVKISAAVFWNWIAARDSNGQDWKLWIEKGYLDFICPMQYTTDSELFEHEMKSTSGWVAGRIPLMPGIGATLGLSPDGTLQQILIARKHKTAGFVLFNCNSALVADHLPLLHSGATAE